MWESSTQNTLERSRREIKFILQFSGFRHHFVPYPLSFIFLSESLQNIANHFWWIMVIIWQASLVSNGTDVSWVCSPSFSWSVNLALSDASKAEYRSYISYHTLLKLVDKATWCWNSMISGQLWHFLLFISVLWMVGQMVTIKIILDWTSRRDACVPTIRSGLSLFVPTTLVLKKRWVW